MSNPDLGPKTRFLFLLVAGLFTWGALSEERTGLSFTVAADSRQRSHSHFRVPRVSWPHFTVSHSRLPQPGGPGPLIYIPQEKGDPVILFSSSPTTRRATVEVFKHASTQGFSAA
jgi:hypothetical protein